MKQAVLQVLKPKAASLGFNREELESYAEHIATQLNEDANQEDINAAIDAVYPLLRVSQRAVNRIVNERKQPKEEQRRQPLKTDAPDVSELSETEEGATTANGTSETNELLKLIKEQGRQLSEQRRQLDALLYKDEATRRGEVYKAKLSALPETLKRSKLKDFTRMSFASEDDFNAFIEETEQEVSELVKDFGQKRLSLMGRPIVGSKVSERKPTDEELKKVFG